MSKEMTILALGVLNIIIATGLVAVPGTWRMILFVVIGLALIICGFLLRTETLSRGSRLSRNSSFVESVPGQGDAVSHLSHTDSMGSLN